MKYSNSQIEALIKGIEDGTITEWNLPKDYYKALTDYLKKALFEGFGATLETVASGDVALLEELVTNMYMFSGGKTFHIVKEISGLLVDSETGEVRSSREFNKLGRELYDTWNDNWGRTEYNTAIAQGDSAAKWQEIQSQKDVMPNLKYSAIGDACIICAPLDGVVAPVDSPIWDKVAPINHFNCKCLLLQVGGDIELTKNGADITKGVVDKMDGTFINNVGKTGEVFTKDHPYFDVAKEYKAYAKNNFNLPLPKFAE
jgi:hypothetical protein